MVRTRTARKTSRLLDSGTVTVCVPHDRGKPSCGDGGPLVDPAGGH